MKICHILNLILLEQKGQTVRVDGKVPLYEVGNFLGGGAAGQVYEAENAATKENFALKVLNPLGYKLVSPSILRRCTVVVKGKPFTEVAEKAGEYLYKEHVWWLLNGSTKQYMAAYYSERNNSLKELSLNQCVQVWGTNYDFGEDNGSPLSSVSTETVEIVQNGDGPRIHLPLLPPKYVDFVRRRSRIFREIKNMRKISNHKHVIRLDGVLELLQESKCTIFLVMELANGGELFDRIKIDCGTREDTAKNFFQQLLDGVRHCHDQGVCHRDLKPENLLLTDTVEHGTILKIADFGFSARFAMVAMDENTNSDEWDSSSPLSSRIKNFKDPASGEDINSPTFSSPGIYNQGGMTESVLRTLTSVVGSPFYVAPEILQAKGYSGPKADVWSLGVILYAMLAGNLPFGQELVSCKRFKHFCIWVREQTEKGVQFWSEPVVEYPQWLFPAKFSANAKGLIVSMLHPDPQARISVPEAQRHSWCSVEPEHVPIAQSTPIQNKVVRDMEDTCITPSAPGLSVVVGQRLATGDAENRGAGSGVVLVQKAAVARVDTLVSQQAGVAISISSTSHEPIPNIQSPPSTMSMSQSVQHSQITSAPNVENVQSYPIQKQSTVSNSLTGISVSVASSGESAGPLASSARLTVTIEATQQSATSEQVSPKFQSLLSKSLHSSSVSAVAAPSFMSLSSPSPVPATVHSTALAGCGTTSKTDMEKKSAHGESHSGLVTDRSTTALAEAMTMVELSSRNNRTASDDEDDVADEEDEEDMFAMDDDDDSDDNDDDNDDDSRRRSIKTRTLSKISASDGNQGNQEAKGRSSQAQKLQRIKSPELKNKDMFASSFPMIDSKSAASVTESLSSLRIIDKSLLAFDSALTSALLSADASDTSHSQAHRRPSDSSKLLSTSAPPLAPIMLGDTNFLDLLHGEYPTDDIDFKESRPDDTVAIHSNSGGSSSSSSNISSRSSSGSRSYSVHQYAAGSEHPRLLTSKSTEYLAAHYSLPLPLTSASTQVMTIIKYAFHTPPPHSPHSPPTPNVFTGLL